MRPLKELIAWVILTFNRIETGVRVKCMHWIRAIPGFLQYSMLRKFSLLREISEIFDTQSIPHCVTGGFAYDAKRGRLTRYHNDVDFSLLDEHAEAAIAELRRCGFDISVITPYYTVASRDKLSADLFIWRRVERGCVETMYLTEQGPINPNCSIVRIPRSFLLGGEEVELMGVRFRVSCNELLVSILPFIEHEEDKQLVRSLETRVPMRFDTSETLVQMRVKRLEFRGESSGPDCES